MSTSNVSRDNTDNNADPDNTKASVVRARRLLLQHLRFYPQGREDFVVQRVQAFIRDPFAAAKQHVETRRKHYLTLSRLAKALGTPTATRLRHMVLHALEAEMSDKHTCVTWTQLVTAARVEAKRAGFTAAQADAATITAVNDGDLHIQEVGQDTWVYSAGAYAAEVYVASRLKSMLGESSRSVVTDATLAGIIADVERQDGICLAPEQVRALQMAFTTPRGNVCVITGAAGTGKSLIGRVVARLAASMGWRSSTARRRAWRRALFSPSSAAVFRLPRSIALLSPTTTSDSNAIDAIRCALTSWCWTRRPWSICGCSTDCCAR